MLPEDVLLVAALGVVLGVVGWPIYSFLSRRSARKRDPLEEAQERLRVAKRDAEAARLNREAEQVYERMYDDAIGDDPATAESQTKGPPQGS